MSQGLLNNRFAPITSDIGYIEENAVKVAGEFLEWQTPIQKSRGAWCVSKFLTGDISEILNELTPLTSIERRRHLF